MPLPLLLGALSQLDQSSVAVALGAAVSCLHPSHSTAPEQVGLTGAPALSCHASSCSGWCFAGPSVGVLAVLAALAGESRLQTAPVGGWGLTWPAYHHPARVLAGQKCCFAGELRAVLAVWVVALSGGYVATWPAQWGGFAEPCKFVSRYALRV